MCRTVERPNPIIWLMVLAICLSLTFGIGYLVSALFSQPAVKHSATTTNKSDLLGLSTVRHALYRKIQDSGHSKYHEWYKKWENAKKEGCCSDQDCKPFDGQYRWLNDSTYSIEALIEGVWIKIDRYKVMKNETPDGGPHICILPQNSYEPVPLQQRVRCFNPGNET